MARASVPRNWKPEPHARSWRSKQAVLGRGRARHLARLSPPVPAPGTRAADGKGGNWIKAFAIADDREDADGAKVLDFWQAQERARKLARGQDADAGRPATVDEALTDYAADLAVRGATRPTPTRVRHHSAARCWPSRSPC